MIDSSQKCKLVSGNKMFVRWVLIYFCAIFLLHAFESLRVNLDLPVMHAIWYVVRPLIISVISLL